MSWAPRTSSHPGLEETERVFRENKLSSIHPLGPQAVPANAESRSSGPPRRVGEKGKGDQWVMLGWSPQAWPLEAHRPRLLALEAWYFNVSEIAHLLQKIKIKTEVFTNQGLLSNFKKKVLVPDTHIVSGQQMLVPTCIPAPFPCLLSGTSHLFSPTRREPGFSASFKGNPGVCCGFTNVDTQLSPGG